MGVRKLGCLIGAQIKEKIMTTTKNLPALFPHFDIREFEPFDILFKEVVETLFPEHKQLSEVHFGRFPKLNIMEYSDRLEIIAEIAGLTKDDIYIKIEDGILTIDGQYRSTRDEENTEEPRFVVRELRRSYFKRDIILGDTLDEESISATFDNGVLKIVINKKEVEKSKARKIEIK